MGQCIGRQNAVNNQQPHPVVARRAVPEPQARALPQPGSTPARQPAPPLPPSPDAPNAPSLPPARQNPSPLPVQSRIWSHDLFALSMWRYESEGDTTEAIRRLRPLQNREVTRLNWSNLGLTTLPAWIGQLRQLDYLDLANNILSELPEEIGELTALKELDISNNQLTQLPAGISRQFGLQRLLANDNQLVGLPSGLDALVAMREMRINHNRITSLPSGLIAMPELIEINAADNAITQPPAMTAAPHILAANTLIWLQRNTISSAPIGQHETEALLPSYRGPRCYMNSELDSALALHPGAEITDPIESRDPARRIQLLLEAAAHLTRKIDTDQHSLCLGTRQLSRKDCLIMAMEIALTHHRQFIPAISHHLINDFPPDIEIFDIMGINFNRAQLADWAQQQNLPTEIAVDNNAAAIERDMARFTSQNVHANPVVLADRQHLDRIKQRVPTPQSIAQAAVGIRAHLAAIAESDVALLGLNTILTRTALIDDFNESPAGALAVLWTHIEQTHDPILKSNLLASMRNKLVEITTGVCSVGMIQRVIDIPTAIDWSLTTEISPAQLQTEMMHLAAEVNEEFERLYGDPYKAVTTVTRYVRPAPLDLSIENIRQSIFKRPANFTQCAPLLLSAIESKQGIIEFASQKSQRQIREGNNPYIWQILLAKQLNQPIHGIVEFLERFDEEKTDDDIEHNHADENIANTFPPILIGGRYQIDLLGTLDNAPHEKSENTDTADDHPHVKFRVVDNQTGNSSDLTLSACSLEFSSDCCLHAAEIERADALYQQHLQRTNHLDEPSVGHTSKPLLLSQGGAHRPLVVLAYREIKRVIDADLLRSEAALDEALGQVSTLWSALIKIRSTTPFQPQIVELKIPLLRTLITRQETQRLADERERTSSTIKRDMFRLKEPVQMVILRGLPAELIDAEIDRIFPADAQI